MNYEGYIHEDSAQASIIEVFVTNNKNYVSLKKWSRNWQNYILLFLCYGWDNLIRSYNLKILNISIYHENHILRACIVHKQFRKHKKTKL